MAVRRGFAVVLLLLVSAALLFYALYLPVKALPALASWTLRMTVYSCQYLLSQSRALIAADGPPLALYQTCVEVAEGLGVVALLLLVFTRWTLPEGPRWKNRLLLVAGVAFASLFFLIAFVAHISYFLWSDHIAPTLWLRNFIFGIFFLSPNTMGTFSFICFVAAALCFALRYGFKTSFFKFAMPSVFALMFYLAVLDAQEMTLHVTLFLSPLTYGGVNLVSNWFVLSVSAFLSVMGRFSANPETTRTFSPAESGV